MSSTLTQRQKRDKATSNNNNNNNNKQTKLKILEEEINKAVQTVQIAKHRTQELQNQWRDHLQRMSYLVVLLAMHQCSKPVSECIQELKVVQPFLDATTAATISLSWPMMSIIIIFSDCIVEFMNVCIAIALFRFVSLKNPHGTFVNRSYCISSSIIVVCLGLFFHNFKRRKMMMMQGEEEEEFQQYDTCVAYLSSWTGEESILDQYNHLDNTATIIERTERQFPVSCIFHIIVTGCYFFMKMGMDHCDANIKAMERVYQELKDDKKNTGGGNNKKNGNKGKKKTR